MTTTSNGLDTLQAVVREQPDIVVLNNDMPRARNTFVVEVTVLGEPQQLIARLVAPAGPPATALVDRRGR